MNHQPICMLRSVRPDASSSSGAAPASPPDEEVADGAAEGELVVADVDHAAVQKALVPIPLPDVPVPTAEEVRRHNLTHLPYKRWCKWCVCARRNNTPHYRLPPFSRKKPLMVLDYCFLRRSDDDLITVLVGRLYPTLMIFACVCDHKGGGDWVSTRLATFFQNNGMHEFIYMSDQEAALNVCVREAIQITRSQGEWVGPIPEHSAVGESQSNARAERAVQGFEDQLRTILAALESSLNARIPSVHPIMRWMVEHTATILNKYAINDDTGTTGDYETHGKDASKTCIMCCNNVVL